MRTFIASRVVPLVLGAALLAPQAPAAPPERTRGRPIRREAPAERKSPETEKDKDKEGLKPREKDKQSPSEGPGTVALNSKLEVNWERELNHYIESTPKDSNLKGRREEVFKFINEGQGRSLSEREVQQWMNTNGISKTVEQNNFRGTLREVSDVLLVINHGFDRPGVGEVINEKYSKVTWNREPTEVRFQFSDGRDVKLGERVIDIVAERPATPAEREAKSRERNNQEGTVKTYFETKNATLRLRKAEIKLFERRASTEELVKHLTDPSKSTSDHFKQLVMDISLAQTQGRSTQWKVREGPSNMKYYLERYGIEYQVYH